MQTVDIPISELKAYDKNAKIHDAKQNEQIANSLLRFGWKQPLVIDKDNVLIVGHGRLEGAKIASKTDKRFLTAPCIIADDLTEEEIKAYRLADNKLNESPWDFDLLDEELQDITEIDMSDFGFDLGEDFSPDDFGENFSLPDGDKPEICTMTFTLHAEQESLIKYAMSLVEDSITETFGNTNKNGNALYEVVRQWAEQRKS